MWLATKGGFLSCVRTPSGGMVVRARERSALDYFRQFIDIDRKMEIVETPKGRDYRFRTFLNPDEFAAAVARMAEAIDYTNYKDAVLKEARAGRVSEAFELALHEVWAIFGRIQKDGPYGMNAPPSPLDRLRRRLARGDWDAEVEDFGWDELDFGEYGTWPHEVSLNEELAVDASPVDPLFTDD